MKPEMVLAMLLEQAPRRLVDLPPEQGLYALVDHEGMIRYIGVTEMGIAKRVLRYQVAGDGNSHKFSTVYNAGRMYHDRRDPSSCPTDGAVAKQLRRLFAREHCRATAVPLPGIAKDELFGIEAEVRAIAPADALSWNDSRRLAAAEPSDLVDSLLAGLGWDEHRLSAIRRQADRWTAINSTTPETAS